MCSSSCKPYYSTSSGCRPNQIKKQIDSGQPVSDDIKKLALSSRNTIRNASRGLCDGKSAIRRPEGRDLHESGRSEGRAAYQELGGEEADPTIGLGTETALPTSGG